MNIRFEKDYLIELYTKGKTTDKKHRFQPNVINGYLKCVKVLVNASRMKTSTNTVPCDTNGLSVIKKGFHLYVLTTNIVWNFGK